jgi:N-acetylglucosaminyldiphosphoundecaprenol N-acetyl-beta-D-mannosaminyltransferase
MVNRFSPKMCFILRAPVSIVTMQSALGALKKNLANRIGGYVCIADVNSLMQTRTNPEHKSAFENAFMVTPDGMPLSLVAKLRGIREIGRVSGPDLLPAVLSWPEAKTWTHYFYGSSPETLKKLENKLRARFPAAKLVGFESPPFRPLTVAENQDFIQRIHKLKPSIIWVGLGAPKQEKLMYSLAANLAPSILIGVGAAFDFHAGTVKRAPLWMQNGGLEWLHRLLSEPKRLWRRYLVVAPQFAVLALLALMQGKIKA